MSDTMLHGVLCMPPELWQDTELDKRQRYSRYLAASRRIEDDEREIERLREALRRLREWGGLGSQKYSASVAFGVTDWIDGGMVGELPALPDYATPNVEVRGDAPLYGAASLSTDGLGDGG